MAYFVFKHEGEIEVSAERADGSPCTQEALNELVIWCRDMVRDVNAAQGSPGLQHVKIEKISIDPAPLELRFVLFLEGGAIKLNYLFTFLEIIPDPKIFLAVVRGDAMRIETYHAADVFIRKAVPWMLTKNIIEIDSKYGAAVT